MQHIPYGRISLFFFTRKIFRKQHPTHSKTASQIMFSVMVFFKTQGELQNPVSTDTKPIWVLKVKKVLQHLLCYLHVSVSDLAHTPQLTYSLDPLDISPSQFPSAGSLCTDMLHLVNKSFGETARASCHTPSAEQGQLCCTSARPTHLGSLPTALLCELCFPTLPNELRIGHSSLQALDLEIMNTQSNKQPQFYFDQILNSKKKCALLNVNLCKPFQLTA